jgi:hypothetical protein
MKVLSVQQPWASLIALGLKDVENRVRRSYYRGPLLIHASSKIDKWGMEDLLDILREDGDEQWVAFISQAPTGCIVGQVEMVDCVTDHPSDWFDGPFGYVLIHPLYFDEPIRMKGKLGIYDLPAELEYVVAEATRLALERPGLDG